MGLVLRVSFGLFWVCSAMSHSDRLREVQPKEVGIFLFPGELVSAKLRCSTDTRENSESRVAPRDFHYSSDASAFC